MCLSFFHSEETLGAFLPVREFKLTAFEHGGGYGTNGFTAISASVERTEQRIVEAAAQGTRVPLALHCCLSDYWFADPMEGLQEKIKGIEKARAAFRFLPVGCGSLNEAVWQSFSGKQPGIKLDDFSILPFFFQLVASHFSQASRSRPGETVPPIDVSGLKGE